MKRAIPLLLVLLLMLCLCGCNTLLCKHKFEEATCQAPKTCTLCGKTEGEIGDHSYTAATCKAPKTCAVCGKTEGSTASHTYADATCTAPKTCTVCQLTEGKALGHTFADATCAAPKTCSVCGATEGEALSHTFVDATCTTPKTCSVCSATEGDALGHTFTDATCTAPKTCSVCSATEGDALGHTFTDATCTAPKTCSVCSATEGSAAGHNYQNGVCTDCGAEEVITHPFGTGTGCAITLSPDGTELTCYTISASELLYDLCTTEKPAKGWYKFREYNGTTYYSPAPSWGWLSISSYTISGRTVQLGLYEETLELELISANQYKVTKGVKSIPAGIVFTFGTDMCSFMGHLYERSCENDVTCMYCGHFKCAGLGHEYGEDDICFRCYAAMRPSN